MQSRTARNLAIAMIVVALGLGFLALRLGRTLSRPAPTEVVVDVRDDLPRVVVATARIDAGAQAPREVLSLEAVAVVPEGAFREIEEVVGRKVYQPVGQGEPVLSKHFRPPGPVAKRLGPGERAVALQVDDVIGLGGFIQPDDRVDVLLYLARDQEVDSSQARVLLEDIRVLAYGANLERREVGDDEAQSKARTAVLAVPEQEVDRLMLGASKGRLRLALRGDPDEDGESGAPVAVVRGDGVETLASLTASGPRRPAKPSNGSHGAAPAPRAGVSVLRGNEREIDRY